MLDSDERTQAAVEVGHPEWAELPCTRKEAKALGVHYFTGRPCKRGHISDRLSAGTCAQCHRDAMRDHCRTPEYRAWQRSYCKRPHRMEARRRIERRPKWKEYQRAYTMLRFASQKRATPGWLTPEHLDEMRAIYAEAARLTDETGIAHHVDHIIPLTHSDVQGLHVPWNLQVLRQSENASKCNAFDGTHENDSWRKGTAA